MVLYYELLTNKKARLDSFTPLPDVLMVNLDDWFHFEVIYTSNAIKGNIALNINQNSLPETR